MYKAPKDLSDDLHLQEEANTPPLNVQHTLVLFYDNRLQAERVYNLWDLLRMPSGAREGILTP